MIVLEYKLKGKPAQFARIDEAIRTMQFIRNKAVRYWMDTKGANKYDLNKLSKSLAAEFPFSDKLNSMARQAACDRAWASISRFFENCKKKRPGKKGYPRFQKDNRSVEYKTSGWKLTDGCRKILLTDGHEIGSLKLVGTVPLNQYDREKIKRVRLLRKADGYYAQFVIDVERQEADCYTGQMVGLDLGLTAFFTDSNGATEENPRLLRKSEKSLKRLSRRLSRTAKGSNKRKEARKRLARKHLKVQRQRKDFATKLARCVIQSNDLVAIENLQVRNMVKNRSIAKSISDAGWRLFRSKLEQYAERFRKVLVAVNPRYTSQNCSTCGKTVKKSLSTRTHICPCGCILDRDHNAALNILQLGIAQLSTAGHAGMNAPGEVGLCLELATAHNKPSR